MKASELMIGDWVRNSALNEVFKMNTTSMRNMCWDEDNGMARYTIEPIPLTEEILKANGFELHSFNGVKCYERPEFVIHHSMRDCVGRNNFTYKFVHQLQHALRLCGLNDLADSFKV